MGIKKYNWSMDTFGSSSGVLEILEVETEGEKTMMATELHEASRRDGRDSHGRRPHPSSRARSEDRRYQSAAPAVLRGDGRESHGRHLQSLSRSRRDNPRYHYHQAVAPHRFSSLTMFYFGSDSVLVWIRVLVFWEHRELFPLAISYKILNFWISFGSPRTIPKVRDVSGGVNQIGRTNEVKMKNLWS